MAGANVVAGPAQPKPARAGVPLVEQFVEHAGEGHPAESTSPNGYAAVDEEKRAAMMSALGH